jgi:hypothetical protein
MIDAYVVVVSDRWEMLRRNIPSWLNFAPKAKLIIVAWGVESLGWPNTKHIVRAEEPFSLGRGRNIGVAECNPDWLVAVMDADMIMPKPGPHIRLPILNQVLFPICHLQDRDPNKPMTLAPHGWGNAVGYAGTLSSVKWPERLHHGGEDIVYYKAVQAAGIDLVRCEWPGLIHRWHPKPPSEWYDKSKRGT